MGRHHVRPCLWSRHVIVLAVANRSIFVSINSSALPSLATLRLLHLSYNSFHDSSIPSNLTHLELSCSGFTGQIPAAALARLTNLQREWWSEFGKPERASEPFEAGKTPSERGQHLTCLAQFHSLDLPPPLLLAYCQLVGEFPANIFPLQLPPLETLDVSINPLLKVLISFTAFSTSLPSSFANLSYLTTLDLRSCGFSASTFRPLPPNPFSSLLNLTPTISQLYLFLNRFSGWIPPLDSLKSIVRLDLSYNNLTGRIPISSGRDGLSSLQLLYLNNNALHGHVPLQLFFTLPSLQDLLLDNNQLDGELPDTQQPLHAPISSQVPTSPLSKNCGDCCTCGDASGHVTALDVAAHAISTSINSSALASITSLRLLNLSHNSFNTYIPPNLTRLDLSYSVFTGLISAAALARLANLVVLAMSAPRNSLRRDWENTSTLRKSEAVELDKTPSRRTGLLPCLQPNFMDLASLRLRSCQLVGEFPAWIFQLPKLETPDATDNPQLKGSFPPYFPVGSALRGLIISAPGFSGGPLPYSLRNPRNLTYYNFSGPITTLAHLTRLEYIDLTWSHFSGHIPSLLNHTPLAILYLGMNELREDVPYICFPYHLYSTYFSTTTSLMGAYTSLQMIL
ncbi:hypothetical protein ACLOJK_001962 [Asimina triloba]